MDKLPTLLSDIDDSDDSDGEDEKKVNLLRSLRPLIAFRNEGDFTLFRKYFSNLTFKFKLFLPCSWFVGDKMAMAKNISSEWFCTWALL